MSDRTPNYYIAIILAASPAGWFGIHHIYLGNKKRGIAYFVLFFTLIPALLALVESFLMIYYGEEWFIEKYGEDEDLEQYHLRELQRKNPVLAQRVAMNMGQSDDIDPDEIEDIARSEAEQMNEETESEQEYDGKPDYSDYYGDWNG